MPEYSFVIRYEGVSHADIQSVLHFEESVNRASGLLVSSTNSYVTESKVYKYPDVEPVGELECVEIRGSLRVGQEFSSRMLPGALYRLFRNQVNRVHFTFREVFLRATDHAGCVVTVTSPEGETETKVIRPLNS